MIEQFRLNKAVSLLTCHAFFNRSQYGTLAEDRPNVEFLSLCCGSFSGKTVVLNDVSKTVGHVSIKIAVSGAMMHQLMSERYHARAKGLLHKL